MLHKKASSSGLYLLYMRCSCIAITCSGSIRAPLLRCLYVQTAEGTPDEPKAPSSYPELYLVVRCPMTPDAFTASLERSAAKHPPSKARRIAALLPQIEAAMAQGSPRAHIVTALLDVGLEVTPHQLSIC